MLDGSNRLFLIKAYSTYSNMYQLKMPKMLIYVLIFLNKYSSLINKVKHGLLTDKSSLYEQSGDKHNDDEFICPENLFKLQLLKINQIISIKNTG